MKFSHKIVISDFTLILLLKSFELLSGGSVILFFHFAISIRALKEGIRDVFSYIYMLYNRTGGENWSILI